MIEFKNVVKRFADRTILKGLNLTVSTGEILFILGTSGTGKSVLLKTLVGLLRPDEGEVWIEGQETSRITEIEYLEIRKFCGMVFQQPALFDSLTIFDNIAFGLRKLEKLPELQVRERVAEALQAVHLQDVERRFPQEISYGMQKRASLARTLALKPRILLFDEPTTGLDPVTTTAVNELIEELSRKFKTTSLVVSHDMNCALQIADRIIVLDQGHILAQGTPADLRRSDIPLVRDFLSEVEFETH